MVRLLRDQSDKNKLHKTKPRRMIGNRSTEKDLRDFLTENGYYGNSANFHKLELAAIERPGWVQVFEFHVLAKSVDGDWVELFGNCRSDERSKSLEVNLFDSNVDQSQAFRDETAEMITLDRGPRHWTYWPLMTFFVALLAVAAYGAWLANKPEIAENAPGQSTSQPVAQPELPAERNTDAETAPIR